VKNHGPAPYDRRNSAGGGSENGCTSGAVRHDRRAVRLVIRILRVNGRIRVVALEVARPAFRVVGAHAVAGEHRARDGAGCYRGAEFDDVSAAPLTAVSLRFLDGLVLGCQSVLLISDIPHSRKRRAIITRYSSNPARIAGGGRL